MVASRPRHQAQAHPSCKAANPKSAQASLHRLSTSLLILNMTTLSNPHYTPPQPFSFPRYHAFPPFYTPQPQLSTRHAQLQKWSALILAYCAHFRLFKLSLSEALESELFWNRAIGKRLGRETAREVVEFMRGEGRAEWVKGGGGEGQGSVFWVWWRDVEEWAGLIGGWVDETAQKNTVLTLYELTESEATISQDFHGMDAEILQKALAVLVQRGKAQVFGQEDQQGVKFF